MTSRYSSIPLVLPQSLSLPKGRTNTQVPRLTLMHSFLLDKMNRASKRINFAMTENKCRSLKQIDVSIQQSPNFQPFDATKRPAKGPILKTPPSLGKTAKPKVCSNKRMLNQTVMYNTMVNGKSKFASRPVASDFF